MLKKLVWSLLTEITMFTFYNCSQTKIKNLIIKIHTEIKNLKTILIKLTIKTKI